jgi:uncharacterized protein with HEPN domain
MPSRDWRLRIEDMLEAIDKIERYTKDMDYETWLRDEKTVDAVVRNIEIIGEASAHLPDDILERYSDIPWPFIRGIRNVLAHEYFGVDVEVIWKTVKEDLPALKTALTG